MKNAKIKIKLRVRGIFSTFKLYIKTEKREHLFQNRYKSILCEKEPYFLELVRYIHLNPLRANIVKGLSHFGFLHLFAHTQDSGFYFLPANICHLIPASVSYPFVNTFVLLFRFKCNSAMKIGGNTQNKTTGEGFFRLLANFLAGFEIIVNGFVEIFFDFRNRSAFKTNNVCYAENSAMKNLVFSVEIYISGISFVFKSIFHGGLPL